MRLIVVVDYCYRKCGVVAGPEPPEVQQKWKAAENKESVAIGDRVMNKERQPLLK